MELDKIKTREDLIKLLKFLRDQGFYGRGMSEHELHESKIDDTIIKSNKLQIKIDDNLKRELTRLTDYDEIKKKSDEYFSKFNVNDKITELIEKFYIQNDASSRTPSRDSSNAKEIIDWFNFKTKYNLNDFEPGKSIEYYNLDKNYLKIRFSDHSSYEFSKLYELIFNEKCQNFDETKAGMWQDLGKIQIKFFLKGGADIKGDLDLIKEYQYKYINKPYRYAVIKYKNKVEIFKGKNVDNY